MGAPDVPPAQAWIHEPVSCAHVPPHRCLDEPGQQDAAEVELLGYRVANVRADYCRREGQEGDARELQQAQPQQARVDPADELEEAVVDRPEDARSVKLVAKPRTLGQVASRAASSSGPSAWAAASGRRSSTASSVSAMANTPSTRNSKRSKAASRAGGT